MFSSKEYIEGKGKKSGRDRFSYLQALVTEFQDTEKSESRYQILANLANFGYDPVNYEYFEKLNVVDLFLDMLSEEDERLVEYGIAGICNVCLHSKFRSQILDNDGVSLIISCLSSNNEETVVNALTTIVYLLSVQRVEELVTTAIVDCMKKFAESDNVRLKNLAHIYFEDYTDKIQQ